MQVSVTLTGDEATLLKALQLLNDTKTGKVLSAKKMKEMEKLQEEVNDLIEEEVAGEQDMPMVDIPEDDEEELLDENNDDDEEEKPAKKAKKLTLDGNIIPSFRAFAKKHSREKAGAVLAKFKVKSVRDLKETDYPKVLKLLSV